MITLGLERTQGRHRECVLGLRHHVPGCRCRGHRDGDHRRGCRQRARMALDLAGCRRWPRGPCAAGRGVRDSASGGADRRAAAGGRVAAAGLRSAVASQGDGAAAAFVVIASAGLVARGAVQRIPRSALQLLVGTLLSSFGTFWAVEGLGVAWPGSDAAILVLVGWYVLAAVRSVGRPRPAARRLLSGGCGACACPSAAGVLSAALRPPPTCASRP